MDLYTKPLYSTNSYLKELATKIIGKTKKGVIPDTSIFYPRGGGQPEDKGVLIDALGGEFPVLGLYRVGNALEHHTSNNFEIGDQIKMKIDWEYRYKLMKHHTSLHLLSAAVNNMFDETTVTGGNIYPDRARLDFDLKDFDKSRVPQLIEKLNEMIRQEHEVSIAFMNRDEAESHPQLFRTTKVLPKTIQKIRVIKIGDVDIQADGGLHVNNTREIGKVVLVSTDNKGKGRKRITIKVVD